ncbi:MAG: hypothetical protein KF852_10595 [Saprospiraceae bacterium]|nr:hypothetical protein [Saprospiraceae bacterium]
MPTISEHIRESIAADELETALQQALEYLKGKDALLYNECLQHRARLSGAGRDFRMGIIRVDDKDLVVNQIRYALTKVAGQIEQQLIVVPEVQPVYSPPPAPAPQIASTVAPPAPDDAPAHDLISRFVNQLLHNDVESAARAVMPLLHRSLLRQGVILPDFRKNNLDVAHERIRLYRLPVVIIDKKSTNRNAIGVLADKEHGAEWMYSIAKMQDTGGLPAYIRVFFPQNGGEPRITGISL